MTLCIQKEHNVLLKTLPQFQSQSCLLSFLYNPYILHFLNSKNFLVYLSPFIFIAHCISLSLSLCLCLSLSLSLVSDVCLCQFTILNTLLFMMYTPVSVIVYDTSSTRSCTCTSIYIVLL